MAQPPTRPVITRELVRFIPFAAQHTFRNAVLGSGATMVAAYDVADPVTDINQLLGTAPPSADPTQFAVGPFLDALWFSDSAGLITVEFAVDSTCAYRNITGGGIVVAAGVAANISGMRITGRFVRVTFQNTAVGTASVEFGTYIRST